MRLRDCTFPCTHCTSAGYLSVGVGCSPRDDFETTHQVVLALAQSENLCNRVWPMNMIDLICNNIQDYFNTLVLVSPSSRYVASVTSLSWNKDGTGATHGLSISADYGIGLLIFFSRIQAVRSLIHKSFSKFEAVCRGYSCHPVDNTPLDPRIYEIDFLCHY